MPADLLPSGAPAAAWNPGLAAPPDADRLAAAAAAVERLHGAPRDAGMALDHLIRGGLAGRLYVCGAGSHTRLVLEALARVPAVTVLGVVDRLGAALGAFEGFPVLTPEEAAGRPCDGVLVAHTAYEEEMAARLLAAGVPTARLRPLYSDPAYAAAATPPFLARLFAQAPEPDGVDYLVVTAGEPNVVPDRHLAAVLPPDRTLAVCIDRAFRPSPVYRTLDLRESATALVALAARLRPKLVYCRTVLPKNHYALLLQQRLPHLPVIHELWDYALLWPDADLAQFFGFGPRAIERLRLAERLSAQAAALTVSKRGGPVWERALAGCAAPYRLYFPMAEAPDAAAAPAADTERRGLLYAGFLPAPAVRAQFRNGYDFLGLLEAVCAAGGRTADLFNSAHGADDPDGDRIFAGYRAAWAEGPVRYHRCRPYRSLVAAMGRWDFGWLVDRVHAFQPDRVVGVCNRWTGYISGGLPVLMDPGWQFMGELVRRFEAGVIVPDAEPAAILAALAAADRPKLAAGAARLRAHLIAHNAGTLDTIGALAASD